MTRLYYTDPSRLTFDALVQRCEPAPASHPGAFAVWLSESAFYPTTGGQPFDTGRLGDAKVVDVFETQKAQLPLITRMLIATSDFFRNYLLYLVIALVAAFFGFRA